jgi:hypothetical protein
MLRGCWRPINAGSHDHAGVDDLDVRSLHQGRPRQLRQIDTRLIMVCGKTNRNDRS